MQLKMGQRDKSLEDVDFNVGYLKFTFALKWDFQYLNKANECHKTFNCS